MFLSMLLAVALVGFSGSMHCALMCGPLAGMACQGNSKTSPLKYHCARLMTYTILGFIAGFVGSQLPAPFLESSQFLAVAFGVIVVGAGIFYLFRDGFGLKLETLSFKNVGVFTSTLRRAALRFSPFSREITLGILTGILPCGFLYVGLLQSTLMGSPLKSATSMAVFAVSTAPALWIGTGVLSLLKNVAGKGARVVVPLLTIAAGVLILLRTSPGHQHKLSDKSSTSPVEQQESPQRHHHH